MLRFPEPVPEISRMFRLISAFALLLTAASASAYVGPGAGISVLGSLLAIVAIVMWPIRKMMKRRKAAAAAADSAEAEEQA
jgi:hypothetical protein